MQGLFLRKYGVQTTINFTLFEIDGVDFRVNAVYAANDTKIMKDEGDEANTTNGFVDEGQGYSITLTATEMQAARIVVYIADQGTKVWLDTSFVIETYGHASAMHAMDFDSNIDAILDSIFDDVGDVKAVTDELASKAAIADTIWDEAKAGHTAAGSFGEEVQAHALTGADSDTLETLSDQMDTLAAASGSPGFGD